LFCSIELLHPQRLCGLLERLITGIVANHDFGFTCFAAMAWRPLLTRLNAACRAEAPAKAVGGAFEPSIGLYNPITVLAGDGQVGNHHADDRS
jgi:hypothetical protein